MRITRATLRSRGCQATGGDSLENSVCLTKQESQHIFCLLAGKLDREVGVLLNLYPFFAILCFRNMTFDICKHAFNSSTMQLHYTSTLAVQVSPLLNNIYFSFYLFFFSFRQRRPDWQLLLTESLFKKCDTTGFVHVAIYILSLLLLYF